MIAFPARPPHGGKAAARASGTAPVIRLDLLFSGPDHAALAAWAGDGAHGYDRMQVECATQEDGTRVSYALIYMPGLAWATWGVTRRDGQVEVWRCATGQTAGRHARMADALASLPHMADAAGAARGQGAVRAARGRAPGLTERPPPG